MKENLVFKSQHPQKTWTVNLRRRIGKPKVEWLVNLAGKPLSFKSNIIGDKLIVVLKEGPAVGRMKISFSGSTALYLYKPSLWKRIKTFFGRFFNRRVKR